MKFKFFDLGNDGVYYANTHAIMLGIFGGKTFLAMTQLRDEIEDLIRLKLKYSLEYK